MTTSGLNAIGVLGTGWCQVSSGMLNICDPDHLQDDLGSILLSPLALSFLGTARGVWQQYFPGLGPPWKSHPCIEGYPQCHMVRAVDVERSDR